MKEQQEWSLAIKHAAVVRRAVVRQLERITQLEASGFSAIRAQQALEVLLRVLARVDGFDQDKAKSKRTIEQ
jgi:hypothetical protein